MEMILTIFIIFVSLFSIRSFIAYFSIQRSLKFLLLESLADIGLYVSILLIGGLLFWFVVIFFNGGEPEPTLPQALFITIILLAIPSIYIIYKKKLFLKKKVKISFYYSLFEVFSLVGGFLLFMIVGTFIYICLSLDSIS